MKLKEILEGLLNKTIQEPTLLFVTPSTFTIMTADEEFVKPFIKAWNNKEKEEERFMGAYSINIKDNTVKKTTLIPLEEFKQLILDGKITVKEDIEKDEEIAHLIPLGGHPFVIPSHKLQIDRDGEFEEHIMNLITIDKVHISRNVVLKIIDDAHKNLLDYFKRGLIHEGLQKWFGKEVNDKNV